MAGRSGGGTVSWLHVGDLHVTDGTQQNYADLRAIVDLAGRAFADGIDFVLLPGDNADQGAAEQFRLVRDAIAPLRVPVHILPGDHDFHSGSLDAFHSDLEAERLPKSVRVRGYRCLFLDVVSAGGGGPDFRVGPGQLEWVEGELVAADEAGERPLVFMHCFPADLAQGDTALSALIARHRVACVDMGHTHYNELANDGRTIFMATRSTGQIEEGPPGFSVAAVDGGVVSWRFRALEESGPLVLITCPADHRLIADPASPDQVVRGSIRVGAKVWSERDMESVTASIGEGREVSLARDQDDPALWGGVLPDVPSDGLHRLTVRACCEQGVAGEETIIVLVSRNGTYETPPRHADGSDRDSVGAWPEKHLLGTRLGPNANGHGW